MWKNSKDNSKSQTQGSVFLSVAFAFVFGKNGAVCASQAERMTAMNYQTRIALSVMSAVCLLLGGCMFRSMEEYRQERADRALEHLNQSQDNGFAGEKVISLDECIAMALKHNLDLQVVRLDKEVAEDLKVAEILGMLPELTISDTYTRRDNTAASSSSQIDGGLGFGTYSYSTSQDDGVNNINVDLALSVLDFGLAYFNSQQAHDRVLVRQQRIERAEQNLRLDVVRVYFQVAASQRAVHVTKKLLEDCHNRYELIAEMGRAGQITPFRAFDETKRFIDMEKRLTNYIRTYENSCVELRSLLGLYPNSSITVDDSVLDQELDFKLPEITIMEQIALLRRPELLELDMQSNINVIECRKSILMMFPNVRVFADFTDNSNSFLYNRSWMEIGVRAAYNLLKLPQQYARYQANEKQVDSDRARIYAQAIGIMAQVRIAQANLLAAKDRLAIDNRSYAAFSRNLKWAEANKRQAGELSQLELEHIRMQTVESEIERYMSLGIYFVSYYRVLNTLGVFAADDSAVVACKEEMAAAKARLENSVSNNAVLVTDSGAEIGESGLDESANDLSAPEGILVEGAGDSNVELGDPVTPVPVVETQKAAAPEATIVVEEETLAPTVKEEPKPVMETDSVAKDKILATEKVTDSNEAKKSDADKPVKVYDQRRPKLSR